LQGIRMHSYKEEVSLPMHIVEDRKAGERRPMRVAVVASSLALMACVAVLMVSGEGDRGTAISLAQVGKPKFVDWKKEDAGSDDMNLHLKVADALAKADGIGESGLAPVPEGLLKMAQRAAEEQKTMPDDPKKAGKPKIPASLEKMFQQAMDEQHVEKLAKEGQKTKDTVKANSKEEAQKRVAAAHAKAAAAAKQEAATEKKTASALLNSVSKPAAVAAKPAAPAAAPAAAAAPTAAAK